MSLFACCCVSWSPCVTAIRRATGSSERCLEGQPGGSPEDAVVGHQRDAEVYGGRGDPTIDVVLPLRERMSRSLASQAEVDLRGQKRRARPDHLRAADVGLGALESPSAPVPPADPEADLGERLERDEEAPPARRGVALHQVLGGSQQIG